MLLPSPPLRYVLDSAPGSRVLSSYRSYARSLHSSVPIIVFSDWLSELDLVFPRKETYLPVYPFPVVFALRNPSVIWPFDFSFISELRWYDESLGRDVWTDGGFERLGHFPNSQSNIYHDSTEYPVAKLGEPFYVINSSLPVSDFLSNTTTTTPASMSWSFVMRPNCTKNASRTETVGFSRTYAGSVKLSFGPDGILPGFNDYEGFPIPVATIGIKDLWVPPYFWSEVGNCPVLQDHPLSPNPCGLNVSCLPAGLGTRVAKAMMESTYCEGGAEPWPIQRPTRARSSRPALDHCYGHRGVLTGLLRLLGWGYVCIYDSFSFWVCIYSRCLHVDRGGNNGFIRVWDFHCGVE
jgi:hypothetical protein